MIMTNADIDANRYLESHQLILLTFVAVWIFSYGFSACSDPQPLNQAQWISNLPFVYMLIRWKGVVHMRPGYPLFTELWGVSLALSLLATGIEDLVPPSFQFPQHQWAGNLIGTIWVVGALGMLLLIRRMAPRGSCHSQQSATAQFFAATYSYLLLVGVVVEIQDIAMQLLGEYNSAAQPLQFRLTFWLFAPIHTLPPLIMLISRKWVYKTLGTRWLKQRMALDYAVDQGVIASRGDMDEVSRLSAERVGVE
jgi:hypothetical protein